jgi:hypothetical protein
LSPHGRGGRGSGSALHFGFGKHVRKKLVDIVAGRFGLGGSFAARRDGFAEQGVDQQIHIFQLRFRALD